MALINPVMSETDLNADLTTLASAAPGAYTITFGASIGLVSDLNAINLPAGVTLTINGAGLDLDGALKFRGFLVYSGNVTIQNLLISNAAAFGGKGGSGNADGGGGIGEAREIRFRVAMTELYWQVRRSAA